MTTHPPGRLVRAVLAVAVLGLSVGATAVAAPAAGTASTAIGPVAAVLGGRLAVVETDASGGARPVVEHLFGVLSRTVVAGTAFSGAAVSGAAADGGYRWPTGGEAVVVRAFDGPAVPWDAGHRGVDLELAVGAPVLAAADGVVVFAGTVVDRPVVSVDHRDGLRTTYEPVRPAVVAGQRVRAGEVLGHLEAGHCPPWERATCLHWGARTASKSYLDPMDLLGAAVVVRLLPVATYRAA